MISQIRPTDSRVTAPLQSRLGKGCFGCWGVECSFCWGLVRIDGAEGWINNRSFGVLAGFIVVSNMISELTIDCAEARRALDAVYNETLKRGKAGVISVCDAHGELVAFARMDGAPFSSIMISMNKAYSAARERKPSFEIGKSARNPEKGFDIGYFGDPRFTGWGGGVPILKNGVVIGAIAVSGLPQMEDIELAEMGAASISG